MKKNLWIILGIIILPAMIFLWMFDRLLQVTFFWKSHKKFTDWANSEDIAFSFMRFAVVALAIIIYYTIKANL